MPYPEVDESVHGIDLVDPRDEDPDPLEASRWRGVLVAHLDLDADHSLRDVTSQSLRPICFMKVTMSYMRFSFDDLPVVPFRDREDIDIERPAGRRDLVAIGAWHRPGHRAGETRDRARPVARREEDLVRPTPDAVIGNVLNI